MACFQFVSGMERLQGQVAGGPHVPRQFAQWNQSRATAITSDSENGPSKGFESRQMADINGRKRDYSGLKHHAKVHSFRIITAILAWVLIGVAFYYRPDWIKWGLRAATHGIEAVGDAPGVTASKSF
jgi:hypothetical protein